MAEIKELVAKANEQCKRIKDYIAENEGMFDSMDLKLHDASFYEYRNMEKSSHFAMQIMKNVVKIHTFIDFVIQHMTSSQIGVLKKIDFRAMCHHIGRTSSFYLYDKDLVQRENGRINWSWTMYNIFNELGYSNYYQLLEFDNEGNVDEEESFKCNEDYYTREEWIEELKPALQYIVDDMYDDFIREIEDVKRYMSISKIQK